MQSNIAATAVIEPDSVIGNGSMVWDYCHVRNGARVGENCVLGRNVQIDSEVSIGSGCKIQNGVSVYRGVTIEDDVFVGPFAVFTNDLTPRAFNKDWKITPTLVKKGASVGANATIVCGTTLGEYSMVAAGAVVTKDVLPFQLVAGVPAKHLGWVNKSGKLISRGTTPPSDLTV